MAEFRPLSPRLRLYWSKSFDELPDDVKDDVYAALPIISWDGLNPDGRENQIGLYDLGNDPANDGRRKRDFNLMSQIGDLERERRTLELMRATSPLERESQIRQFADIDAQIAAIKAERNGPTITTQTTKQRNALLLKRRKELRAAGVHNPTKTLVQEFGISDSLVRRILRDIKPTKKPKSTGIASLIPRKK